MIKTIKNFLYSKIYTFQNNYLKKFLIVLIIKSRWKGNVHVQNYMRTALEWAEFSKID